MFVPYKTDVPMYRWPWMNCLIIVGTCIVSASFLAEVRYASMYSEPDLLFLVLGESIWSWPGHALLHAGSIHLLGNMLFLFVFGNAICAKVGNVAFLPLYFGLALVSGATHMLIDGDPAIGASGAINGIVGMFAILYPLNEVSVFYMLFLRIGVFYMSSIWLILLWFGFDVLGAATGGGGVAYWAHLGGLAAGVATAVALLRLRIISMDPGERTLLEVLGLDRPAAPARAGVLPAAQAAPGMRTTHADNVIRFQCACGRMLRVPQTHAGKQARCPACGAPVRIPTHMA